MATKHTVKSGETLSAIALRYGTTVGAIRDANKDLIKNVNIIRVGWVLSIPANPETKPSTAPNGDLKALLNEALNDIGCLASVKKLLSLL